MPDILNARYSCDLGWGVFAEAVCKERYLAELANALTCNKDSHPVGSEKLRRHPVGRENLRTDIPATVTQLDETSWADSRVFLVTLLSFC